MLFKSGLGQKQGVGGWGRGGYVEWVGGWGGGGKGWVGGGGGVKGGWGGGWGGWGWGGWVTPLPTHPPLRFTREQTRVEYIRRCRLITITHSSLANMYQFGTFFFKFK